MATRKANPAKRAKTNGARRTPKKPRKSWKWHGLTVTVVGHVSPADIEPIKLPRPLTAEQVAAWKDHD